MFTTSTLVSTLAGLAQQSIDCVCSERCALTHFFFVCHTQLICLIFFAVFKVMTHHLMHVALAHMCSSSRAAAGQEDHAWNVQ
jgi:hypothetical protein